MQHPVRGKSVVVLIPTFNDWDSLASLLPLIDRELKRIGARGKVIVIDDGSTVHTGRQRLSDLSLLSIHDRLIVTLTRNLGSQRAIAIGLSYVADNEKADYVVIMDGDHEDDPVYIPNLLAACNEKGDQQIIFAERTKRSEGSVFRLLYAGYQVLYKILTGLPISIGNYSAIPFDLTRRIASIAELWRHYPASIMRARIPFSTIRAARSKRAIGESKMSLVPHVVHALSGFSVHGEVVAVRVILFMLAIGLLVLAALALLFGIRIFTDIAIIGWTSQVVAILTVLLFQLAITIILMAMFVISQRAQEPAIPASTYRVFILTAKAF